MMKKVVIVEMGVRDGLQNESLVLPVDDRVDFVKRLANAGLRRIEAGAFVSPQWVPQMAGSANIQEALVNLMRNGELSKKLELAYLVPNEKGMLEAIRTGVREVAIFAASSESFSIKNINCSIDESFERFEPVMALARKHKIKVRGYLSTCFGCPFEGKVSEAKVIQLAKRMLRLGVYEISIGDTIGVASAGQVESLFKKLLKVIPTKKLAAHFHDTRGQALANILAAYSVGVRVFDTSLGGLGGCPYAPGATGNVATEDVVYMFDSMGVKSGINLKELLEVNRWASEKVKHALPSKVGQVGVLKAQGKIKASAK